MKTPIVTLTTDWGAQGFFAGMVKGALMSLLEGVQVVDISHQLLPFNGMTASFVVRNACMGFPEGTVHLIDVGSQPPYVVVRARGQYYICSDNGLPSQVFGSDYDEAVTISYPEGADANFPAYRIFVPVAAALLGGVALSEVGSPCVALKQRPWTGYVQQGEYYRIYVQYVDEYGNLYLGMTVREFESLRAGRPFVMQVRGDMEVTEMVPSYYSSPDMVGTLALQLTASITGHLELSLRERSLAQLAGLRENSSVLLRFK